MIELFKTLTGKPWHILKFENEKHVDPLCGDFGYWVGGCFHILPEVTKEKMKRCIYTGKEKICAKCMAKAHKLGMIKPIKIKFIKPVPEELKKEDKESYFYKLAQHPQEPPSKGN
jgi:hypothetical protein